MGEPARLIGTPLAPVPLGGAAEWIEGSGGVRLRAALFPVDQPRGSVFVSPGRTEPIEKYFEVVDELRGRGFAVVVHDWRGQGLSARLHADPMRGHADGLTPYLEDYSGLLDAFEGRVPHPWTALGHSMGGGLAALALVEGEARLAAAVLTAPMLGIQIGRAPVWLALGLSSALSSLGAGGAYAAGPGHPLRATFERNFLTHDRARWERTQALLSAAPELQVGGVTWAWVRFALQLARRLAASAVRVSIPVTVITAAEERLVDNAAARTFAQRVVGARYLEMEGAYHEILMETDAVRARFWTEFDAVAASAPNA